METGKPRTDIEGRTHPDAPREGEGDQGDGGTTPGWAEWASKEEVPLSGVTAEYPGGELRADGPPIDAASFGSSEARREDAGAEAALPDGWLTGVDPCSGYTYYYNTALGRTQWQLPDHDAQ